MDTVVVFDGFEIPEEVEFSQLRVRWNINRDDIDFDRAPLKRLVEHNRLEPALLWDDNPASRTLVRLIISAWYVAQRRAGGERDPIFEQIFAEVEAWAEFGATRVQRSFGSLH